MPAGQIPSPESADASNLYAAPSVVFEESPARTVGQATIQQIRRTDRRERSIKRLSWLNVLLAIIWLPAAVGTLGLSTLLTLKAIGFEIGNDKLPRGMPTGIIWVAITAFHVASFSLNVALVIGLRSLRPWARWTEFGLAIVSLIVCLAYAGYLVVNHKPWTWFFSTSAPAMVLIAAVIYLLLSRPSDIVFSKEHREFISRSG
jgi:hypothetical protein